MKTLRHDKTDPKYNLALEEYLLKHKSLDDDLFYVWRNTPSIIIGRNQNAFEEVHLKRIRNQKIPVIRRISGGGTVYHDLGNINYTFISHHPKEHLSNYEYFINKVIRTLSKLGINATFKPKTHIYVGNHKISGNAQSFHKGRVIHHGTLLFDTNLKALNHLLKTPTKKGHAIQSQPAKTKNIKALLFIEATTESFMNFLVDEVLYNDTALNTFHLTDKDKFIIQQMVKDKYQQWDWNYGSGANFKTRKKVNHSMVTFHIRKGYIQTITSNNDALNTLLSDILIDKPLRYSKLKQMIPPLNKHHINGETLIEKLCFYP
ncbi:MAG: lipoate--protein ligase [Candidatus Izemoplasma sp.]|nr:lipoate--protein ligase [Candidatus Izemoplasma sp.]